MILETITTPKGGAKSKKNQIKLYYAKFIFILVKAGTNKKMQNA